MAVEAVLVKIVAEVFGVEIDVKVVWAEVAKEVRESVLEDEVVGDPEN